MPTLNWIGKDKVINHHQDVPFRVLDHQYGYTPDGKQEAPVNSGNLIIHGDNLEALKSLLPQYEAKVKCIYIDPPYNTGTEGWIYNDNVSDPKLQAWLKQVVGKEGDDLSRHDKWLCMIYPRLVLLSKLLTNDGSLWISIDDNEAHTLKLVLDELFGVSCFIADIIWRKRDGAPNDRKIGYIHEHVLVYGKTKSSSSKKTLAEEAFNLMPRTDKANAEYRVFKEPSGPDPKGAYRKIDTTANGKGGRFVDSLFYPIRNPYTDEDVFPRKGTCWRHSKEEMQRLQDDNRLYWGIDGKSKTPMRKLYVSEAKQGMTTPTIWYDLALNQHATREIEKIFGFKASFETPKPVDLLSLIVHIGTNDNDIVLDSFAGSGTTAHAILNLNKQEINNRKFILVEMEDYAETITAERVKRVINGYADVEGTGGSFDYYELGPSLFDESGNLNEQVPVSRIREYIWYSETRSAFIALTEDQLCNPYFLGIKEDTGYYFCYEPQQVTTLDYDFLSTISLKAEQYVVYADNCLLSKTFLQNNNIIFKKIPRDISRL